MDDDRLKGEQTIRLIFGEAYYQRTQAVPRDSGKRELRDLGIEIIFGRLYDRPGLDTRTRLLCTIAALTVLGLEKQLEIYVAAANHAGIDAAAIKETILLMGFYGGFPNALNAMGLADDLLRPNGPSGSTERRDDPEMTE